MVSKTKDKITCTYIIFNNHFYRMFKYLLGEQGIQIKKKNRETTAL